MFNKINNNVFFKARRHTSFASVYIYPAAGASSNFPEIDKKDLRIDTLRASGAG